MKVQFAEKCAWRAIYVSAGQRQLFRLGFDPTGSSGPQIFFAFLGRFGGRFTVPHLRWGMAMRCNYNPVFMWFYKLQQRVLFALDGRF